MTQVLGDFAILFALNRDNHKDRNWNVGTVEYKHTNLIVNVHKRYFCSKKKIHDVKQCLIKISHS